MERKQHNGIATLQHRVGDAASGIEFGIGVRLVYGTKVLYGYTNRSEADELKPY